MGGAALLAGAGAGAWREQAAVIEAAHARMSQREEGCRIWSSTFERQEVMASDQGPRTALGERPWSHSGQGMPKWSLEHVLRRLQAPSTQPWLLE